MIAFRDETARRLGLDLIVHVNQDGRRARHQSDRLGFRAPYPRDEDRGAAAGARPARLRRRFRRRAPRRGEEPRQGAHFLVPREGPHAGTRATSARSCGTCSTRASCRANRSACFRCRTGPSSTCGSISAARSIPVVPLYFARSGRWCGAAAPGSWSTTSGCRSSRASSPQLRRVRFRTLGCYPLTGRDRIGRGNARRHRGRDGDRPRIGAPGPADRHRRGGVDGEEEAGGLFLMDDRRRTRAADRRCPSRTCCASSPAARSMTASRP